ncbi:hypothetical protein [Burkholderia guangdongensis]|uniref:hypothetical protein n=1 Tax=Burkholderia guangdongensis TaxID=1792500 RepID=UPI0015CAE087|nr:hypothetical protein [Burkholderia guangdongensis]
MTTWNEAPCRSGVALKTTIQGYSIADALRNSINAWLEQVYGSWDNADTAGASSLLRMLTKSEFELTVYLADDFAIVDFKQKFGWG